MATRVQYIVIDDLDASTDGVGTYRFALDGVEYEIDLSQPNWQRLRDALAPFIRAGRRLPKTKPASRRTGDHRSSARHVRAWWADNAGQHGLPPHRPYGPIPTRVYDAHRRATGQPST